VFRLVDLRHVFYSRYLTLCRVFPVHVIDIHTLPIVCTFQWRTYITLFMCVTTISLHAFASSVYLNMPHQVGLLRKVLHTMFTFPISYLYNPKHNSCVLIKINGHLLIIVEQVSDVVCLSNNMKFFNLICC
jgi:hypothetical protein